MKAHLRNIRISPKKLNLIADLVRGKNVESALTILSFTPKKGAKPMTDAIRSAQANAEHNEKADPTKLIIDSIIVNKGPVYKRSLFGGRGRMKPLSKPTAHLSIKLTNS